MLWRVGKVGLQEFVRRAGVGIPYLENTFLKLKKWRSISTRHIRAPIAVLIYAKQSLDHASSNLSKSPSAHCTFPLFSLIRSALREFFTLLMSSNAGLFPRKTSKLPANTSRFAFEHHFICRNSHTYLWLGRCGDDIKFHISQAFSCQIKIFSSL